MNKKFLSSTLFLIILLTGLTFNINNNISSIETKEKPSFYGVDLIKPPLEVYAASDYGTPLDTSDIGLFCYYQQAGGWTLVDTVAAWQEYTNYGNYYDGLVRIYHDPTGNDFAPGNPAVHSYIDVLVRCRTDGYILAWLNQSETTKRFIPYWGIDMENDTPGAWNPRNVDYDTGDVPSEGNATCLSRAIKRIFVAASETFPDHNSVYYYDFEFSTSTRFLFFGKGCEELNGNEGGGGITVYMYYTLPAGVTVDFACAQSFYGKGGAIVNKVMFYIGARYIYYFSDGFPQTFRPRYHLLNSTFRALSTQHSVWLNVDGSATSIAQSVATIMFWTH